MENRIAIRANNQFKSKALNTATAGLAKAFQNIENGRKDACAILAKVEKNKAYKDDGFNSLAEYAETIGLEKSLAHKMENAGRMLISENPEIKEFADKTDFSKLAILSSADETKVSEAIKSGELTAESTQAEVKAWKTDTAKQSKDKVLPNYEVTATYGNGDTFHYDSIAVEAIPEFDGFVKVGSYKPENGTPFVFLFNPETLQTIRYTAVKVKAEKKPVKKSAKDMTKEDLIALAEKLGMKVTFNDEQ